MIRARVRNTGLHLFAERGYANTSLADIARAGDFSLDTVFRHFPTRADLVLGLYHQLAVELEERLPELEEASLSERFGQVMNWKVEALEPHRQSLLALFEEMADDSEEIGVLSPSTEPIRVRVTGVFATLVAGDPELICLLYRLHLGLTWIWFKEPRLYPALLGACKALLKLSTPLLPYSPTQAVMKAAERWSAPLAAPHDLRWDALAEKILRRIFLRRRLQNPNSACAAQPCPICLAPHLAKVQSFIDREEPIQMVLPAFPAKSPNPEKTLGKLPDLGEQLALRTLQTLCDEIAALYAPGAEVVICSDGHVFSDLVLVPDQEVTEYHQALESVVQEQELGGIKLFCLADLHPSPDYPELRRQLMESYGEPLERLRERSRKHPHHRALLDGIHRFIFEDRAALFPQVSRSQNRKQARPIAYQVVARSNAWSRLVADQFPRAVRLSIHPQPDHSDKIGFLLTRAVDNWITPWHGAILLEDDEFLLLKRAEAEAKGGVLVESGGRPSHFELPERRSLSSS